MANGHGGARSGSGPKKGSTQARTRKAHEAIALAFDKIGGIAALVRWAKANPDAFYERVWPKIIPLQLQHSGNPDDATPVRVERIELVGPNTSR